jgi:CHAT domain-containing protein
MRIRCTSLLLSWICSTTLAQTPSRILAPDQPAVLHLTGSDTASFTIHTDPGQYLRIAITSPDTSVEATLLDARSNKLAIASSLGGSGGVAEVAGIADQSSLQFAVRLPRKDAMAREVSVSITSLRPATEKDRSDADAFRTYARAQDPKLKSGAMEAFDRALQLSQAAGDAWLEASLTISKCLAYLAAGEFEKAAVQGEAALKDKPLLAPKTVEGVLVYLTAVAHLQHEESRVAIPLFERALAIEREARQSYEISYSLHNLGVAHWLVGDCEHALEEARQALAIRRELKDRSREAYSLMAVAKDYLCLGDAQHSLDTYAEVMPLWREFNDQANQAAVLNDRGLLYSYLGEWEQAEAAHHDALALRTRLNDKAGLVESLINLGQLQVSQHRYRAAQPSCERALTLARELHYHRGEAYAELNLAEALTENREPARARPMLLDAIHIFDGEGHLPGAAWALELLGKLDRLAGDLPAARSDLEKAFAVEQEVGDRILESITLVDLARVCRAQHDSATALKYADEAIARIEQSRSSLLAPDLRAAWLSSKREVYELRIGLLREGRAAEALATSEEAHSRVLLDALGESHSKLRSGLDPKLQVKLQQIDGELNSRAASLARGSGSKAEMAELHRALDRSLARKQELEAQVREASPRYASLALPSPDTAEDIRRFVLDDDTVLLEYFVGEEHSYVWALTATDLAMSELPGRAALEQTMRNLYTALTERNRRPTNETLATREAREQRADLAVTHASKALGALLLDPIQHQLKHRRMIVVPDGPLYMIPFVLLLPPGGNQEIVYLPSASVLVEMRKEHRDPAGETLPALVIADPVFGKDDDRVQAAGSGQPSSPGPALMRLEYSRQEAQSIAALAPPSQVKTLLDFAADSEVVRHSDLSHYRVIHIASHALLDTENPSLSGIVFSTVDRQGNARDGQVRLHEIYNLSLQARLVVLSACRTALGKEVSGEGMIGLSRGFLYAGAQSVLATLWSVDDYATAQFMAQFYRGLWKERRSPADALHAAQRWMKGQKRLQSPYYWAGYTLTGEWR